MSTQWPHTKFKPSAKHNKHNKHNAKQTWISHLPRHTKDLGRSSHLMRLSPGHHWDSQVTQQKMPACVSTFKNKAFFFVFFIISFFYLLFYFTFQHSDLPNPLSLWKSPNWSFSPALTKQGVSHDSKHSATKRRPHRQHIPLMFRQVYNESQPEEAQRWTVCSDIGNFNSVSNIVLKAKPSFNISQDVV